MTDLTKQLHELSDEYWCKITESPYVERVYFPTCNEDIIVKVLAKVPSYEEWQKLKSEYEAECKRADELEDLYWKEVEKNKKLKDLLKECREKLNSCCPVLYSNLINQIDEVLK